jgi:TRADD-N domain-containing protein
VPSDHATQQVLGALDQSRGKGERRQGYRTVSGLATDTGLTVDEVDRVLADHPELFMRSRVPDNRGNTLFRLRGSAGADSPAIESVAAADPSNVQEVAASQLAISNDYYENVLRQARLSFLAAIVAGAVGLAFFLAAVGFVLARNENDAAIISAISGAIVQAIAGLNFWLYGRTAQQLDTFHVRLEQTQRFLIANSLCESLTDDHRDGARLELIRTIATHTAAQTTTSE